MNKKACYVGFYIPQTIENISLIYEKTLKIMLYVTTS